jgi:spore germination protein KC
MMNRQWLSLLVVFMALIPLTGCWDRRELNELGISVAMGIDKIDNEYQVTAQVVQPGEVAQKKSGAVSGTPVTMYEARGVTIFEALRKMTTTSPRIIYAAHLRVVLLGEDLARDGIGQAMDLLSRNYELRTDFYIIVAKGTTAAKALSILTPLEKIPADKLFKSIETSEKSWAPITAVTLDELIMDFVSEGKHPVLSGAEVIGNEDIGRFNKNIETLRPAAELHNAGLAVFRKDKLLGWLNEEESKGYNYILNNVKSTVGHVSCPNGGNIALEVIHSEAKIKGYVSNQIPRLKLDLRSVQDVGEVECRIDLTQVATFQDLEQRAQKELLRILNQTIDVVQTKYKVDIFGFGNAIHRSDPKAWKWLKKDWDKHFAEASIDVNVQLKIKRTGTITNSFFEQVKE